MRRLIQVLHLSALFIALRADEFQTHLAIDDIPELVAHLKSGDKAGFKAILVREASAGGQGQIKQTLAGLAKQGYDPKTVRTWLQSVEAPLPVSAKPAEHKTEKAIPPIVSSAPVQQKGLPRADDLLRQDNKDKSAGAQALRQVQDLESQEVSLDSHIKGAEKRIAFLEKALRREVEERQKVSAENNALKEHLISEDAEIKQAEAMEKELQKKLDEDALTRIQGLEAQNKNFKAALLGAAHRLVNLERQRSPAMQQPEITSVVEQLKHQPQPQPVPSQDQLDELQTKLATALEEDKKPHKAATKPGQFLQMPEITVKIIRHMKTPNEELA
jgi:hypothetical protein